MTGVDDVHTESSFRIVTRVERGVSMIYSLGWKRVLTYNHYPCNVKINVTTRDLLSLWPLSCESCQNRNERPRYSLAAQNKFSNNHKFQIME